LIRPTLLVTETFRASAQFSLRGRVMAFYSMAFLRTALVGGPLMGWIADAASPPAALVVGGLCCAPAALLAAPALRRQRPAAADLPSR
jgi:MFS family permease